MGKHYGDPVVNTLPLPMQGGAGSDPWVEEVPHTAWQKKKKKKKDT